MKRNKILVGASVALLSLSMVACNLEIDEENGSDNGQVENGNGNAENGSENGNSDGENVEVHSIEDYYPIEKNTNYVYSGHGSEYASYEKYVDYISRDGRVVQYREVNAGTTMARVVELRAGELRRSYSRGEAYYREDYILNPVLRRREGIEREVLLREPLEVGNSWTLEDGRVRSITEVDLAVETPSGEYRAIEVTTEDDEYITRDYYAEGIGHIKSVFDAGDGFEVVSELEEIQRDVAFEDRVNLYYPDLDADTYRYKATPVEFKTNDITRMVLRDLYRRRPEGHDLGAVLTPNTNINYLYLNAKNEVYIDLSEDFIGEMNAGAYYETMLLNSLALTFGDYYNQAERIYLTIDGEDYESGHILLRKGEYMEVDYDNRSMMD